MGSMKGGLKRERVHAWLLGAVTALALAAPSGAFAAGSISGTVSDGVAGVGNYEVEVWQGDALVDQVCTAVGGGWAATNLPAGTYNVRFSGDDGICARSTLAPEWYDNRYRRINADDVVVTDGNLTLTNPAILQDGSEVNGTVTDSLGAGVPSVTVTLFDVDNFVVATTCTAADGKYSLDPVTPGVFIAQFSPSGTCGNAGPYAIQWYDHAPTQNAAAAINIGLAAGQVVDDVDATMLAPVTLTVTTAGTGSGLVTADRGGISCPGVCQASLAPGTQVDLTAQPAAGSVFAGWSGDGCSGTGTCQLTMNGDRTATATFQPASTQPPAGGDPAADPTDPPTPPSATAAPDTKLDQTKIKAKKGKATFAFSGSGGTGSLSFECSLAKASVKSKFRACASPASYRGLKKGSYRFEVRARGADGAIDPSPASSTFKSKKKKRR
jgi:hypothetical protein